MSQKSKHTPGPWIVDDSTGIVYINGTEQDWAICATVNTDIEELPFKQAVANARLIAAAPTMYEYIQKRANTGDPEATEILESINASR